MSEPSFGGYPGLSQSFENVRSMYPHSGGRLSTQIPTTSDFATYMRYHHLANMQGGYSPPGVSKVAVHQSAIRAKYDNLPFDDVRNALNTGASMSLKLAGATIGVRALSSGLSSQMAGSIPAIGAHLNKAGNFLGTGISGMLSSASSYASSLNNIPYMGKAASTALKIASGVARFNPVGWAAILATQVASGAVNAGIEAVQNRRKEVMQMQNSLAGANFYGTDMAFAASPEISGRAARDIVDVFKANTKVSKKFKAGELDTVMQYAVENGLTEGHTGNAGQFSSRILSLAKVAKDLMQMGAGISAKDAMDLQSMASKLGMDRNALTSGKVVKNLINAAKISGTTLSEVSARAEEAGAQYLTMGFSAKQGMQLSAFSTRGAGTMIANGMLTDSEMSRLGGKSGVENAIFRAGTIAMQNNAQLLALGSLKFRDGGVISDSRVMEEFRKGRLSFDDLSLMARKNMAKLQDPTMNKHTQRMMLAAVEAGMPDMVKSISEGMSAEQQMALAGDAILQKSRGSGGVKAAMDEYFGEDTQAKEAFKAYVKNFRKVNNKLIEQDVQDEIESVKRASMGEVKGKTERFVESSVKALDSVGEYMYEFGYDVDYGLKHLAEKALTKEEEEMAGAAGYFGGKKKNSLLARSENSYGNITATYSADKFRDFTRSGMGFDILGGSNSASAKQYLANQKSDAELSKLGAFELRKAIGFNIRESEDTDLFSGDRDKDLIDRMNGEFYSDSFTNSMLNIATGGNFFRENEDTAGLIGIRNAASLYMTYQDEDAQAKYSRRRLELASTADDHGIARGKLTRYTELESAIDLQLEEHNNTFLTSSGGFNAFEKGIREKAKQLNISKEETNIIISKKLRQYKDSSSPADSNKAVAAGQLLTDMRDSANSIDLFTATSKFDETGNIEPFREIFKDIDLEATTTGKGDKTVLGNAGGARALISVLAESGFEREYLEGDNEEASQIKFLQAITRVAGIKGPMSERGRENMLKIHEKLRNAKGAGRAALLAGLKNMDFLGRQVNSKDKSFGELVDINDSAASASIGAKNLATYGGKVGDLAKLYTTNESRTAITENFYKTKNLTLADIVGSDKVSALSGESRGDIEAELGKYSKLSEGKDKEEKLKEILDRVASEFARAPKSQNKEAKNLPQVMELLYSGIEKFNTHMQTIASGVDKSEVKITISK